MSLVSFIWVVYIANKRRRFQEKQEAATKSKWVEFRLLFPAAQFFFVFLTPHIKQLLLF